MIITKKLVQTKLQRLTNAYKEIELMKEQIEQQKQDDSKIFLPAIVLENYNKNLNMLQVHKDQLKTIAKDTIKELEKLKDRYIADKSQANDKDYKDNLDKYVKLAQLNSNAMLKLINYIADHNCIEDLEFLTIPNPKSEEDRAINSKINERIRGIVNDNTTGVLDKLTNDLENAIRGNLLNSTVKMFIRNEEEILEGLETLSPFNATELLHFKANKNPSEIDIQRYKLYQEERLKRINNEPYDTKIDEV